MKPNKLAIAISILTLSILGLGVWLLSRPTGAVMEKSADTKVEVGETNFDWGKIKIDAGNVEKTFVIKNAGSGTLKLSNIFTSCDCTTASVIINGKQSPYFGMHAKSAWIGEVPAGGQAELKVIFDPAYHGPSGLGPMTRQIVVETNDVSKKKLTFDLKGTVVK